ncbi:MAG: hypothetical protein A2268_13170 [Candidatus Raymondbacteria bacterium RifOxyA12_full_50_37]|uniref:Uncharacterized protein n=1 Tax=Candidatus Raymondbacteria bacterium RIFOXYD12_FULL_49_13 TaxID=1817890 RepID=A0A1F7F086_UNCRA|nr:MAG: hypothetical protein A2268_13170 [Candidatus Raymondbacteria bacterium RifOxyA12_full_50_37]OGJ93012.1 MAG: hypothetical protein A2248_18305 [Candidatus Raymondbacteria bacterium RIFOXYA2_FULL_49_16]OGJ93596.1 MAG: hypothetical protein A2350_19120 [Candidatus Raymondbacteria bacterium RifOxyB12_full_50_8]OGJ99925.1 MAG: hypothetical protein A2519_00285 [Candidatus Raymondbacteria bacterium RIFOXYD12_FULL_49_13]OGK01565.1 MAG: hypothetical protein A2487_15595 [Candidatus Raymondbacteria 
MNPKKPVHISEFAEKCLQALSESGQGSAISLGGAFGLSHYHEYRATHDIDAWWNEKAGLEQREKVITVIKAVLVKFGLVQVRAWGDVTSIDLQQEGRAVFSFQIAMRSALLEHSSPSPWPGIEVDSFSDLVASKMSALIERGAPRDFRDIYSLCLNKLISPKECWELWGERQTLIHGNADTARAKIAISTHLERIELHRPLKNIQGVAEQEEARKVRQWYTTEFQNAIMG